MGRLNLLVVTVLIAAPAFAGVRVSCQTGGNEVTLMYDASTETELVRAFALDITVQGATITGVKDANPSYNIYPGSIVIDEETGWITDEGTPVADAAEYAGTSPGLGSNAVTIEMAAMYVDGEAPPAAAGEIITLVLSRPGNVKVTENVIRGGIVMEDATIPANPVFYCPACGCIGDIDADGQVDLEDLQVLAQILLDAGSPFIINTPPAPASADTTADGQVDLEDLQDLASLLIDVGTPFVYECWGPRALSTTSSRNRGGCR